MSDQKILQHWSESAGKQKNTHKSQLKYHFLTLSLEIFCFSKKYVRFCAKSKKMCAFHFISHFSFFFLQNLQRTSEVKIEEKKQTLRRQSIATDGKSEQK